MEEDAIWALERGFWTGDASAGAAMLDPACLMAFPPPAGLVAGAAAIAATLDAAPRWTAVALTEQRLTAPAPGLAVVAYRAEARRGEDPPWRVLCTSTWRRGEGGWRLVQHQQTPC